jgi:alcohol dehydrogenase class IV
MSQRKKQRIQQLPLPTRKGRDTIIWSEYLTDIPKTLDTWNSKRVVLVHSKALDASTSVVKDLKQKLGNRLVASKSGVGSHSPYADVISIAQLLHDNTADCLISIGSSSYSDASKIARLLHATLPRDITVEDIEKLVDQEKGAAGKTLRDPQVKLILVPTSLSASEWNHSSSATNPNTRKKQHFGTDNATPDLILLDPEVASTSPRKLWLSSGMRAVDHCVETLTNPLCNEEAGNHMKEALAILLKGLKEYKEGESNRNREELLDGIAECQLGSRQAMMGLLLWRIPMGASHAIGHQIGSVKGVMHGVTSCVMLASVLRYMHERGLQQQSQEQVLKVFNKTLGWQEASAADAVEKFVKMLELPSNLREVDVTSKEDFDKIAEKTMTDVWGGGEKQLKTKEEVLDVLELARGTSKPSL